MNKEPRSGMGLSAVTFTKISKPLEGQPMEYVGTSYLKISKKFVLILLCLI